jgi:hypothetical protein
MIIVGRDLHCVVNMMWAIIHDKPKSHVFVARGCRKRENQNPYCQING